MFLGKHCTNSAPGKPSVVRRLQKMILVGCRGCIRAYVGCIPAGGKHWGCRDVQGLTGVQQATPHALLPPKERKFCGLAKVRWFRNMRITPLELVFCLLISAHRLSLEFCVLAASP